MQVLRGLIASVFLTSLIAAQSGEVVPNENLVVDGIPKIPSTISESVDRYSNFRAANLTSWHPARREMLISTRFADVPQIHRVTTPGGDRSQLTFYADAVTSAQYEPTEGKFFVFSKDVGGGEFYQLYRYDFDSGDISLLTDGKSRNTDAVWWDQGGKLVYGSTRRTGKDVDLWVVNPADPKTDHQVAQLEGGGWSPLDFSPDGHKILALEEISANESYLWVVDAQSGEKVLITPKGSEKVSYAGGRFAKDGKGVYTTTDKDSEFHRLAYIDVGNLQTSFLSSSIPWDVEEFDLSDDGQKIAFVANEDGYGVLHLYDVASKREKPVENLPKGLVERVHWRRHSHELGFNIDSARSPADVYSLDTETGKLERWTYSETGGLNTASFPEPELIHWKSWDGKSISAFLYRPAANFTGPRPTIILIHGGPEGQFRPNFLGTTNYYLNELGVALIFPNVRGSTGYGKTFLAADNGLLREGSYKDINSLFDWIAQQPALDTKRVLVTGGSYGGFMTLAVATNYNDRICCSVDIVGPSNLVTFLEHTSGYRQDLRRVEYGDERDPKTRAYLESIAPANKAQNITKPMFIIAGKNDPRVPASESEQMAEVLRKNKTPVWFLMAKDEGHGFRKKKNRDFQFYATVMFVKEYLLK